jgi:hypothetical protein
VGGYPHASEFTEGNMAKITIEFDETEAKELFDLLRRLEATVKKLESKPTERKRYTYGSKK